jgi:hypothetical protein
VAVRGRRRSPGRRRRAASALLIATLTTATLLGAAPDTTRAASTITVSGFVFHDLDNDGVKDPGEPGVPGVRVHRTTGNQTPTATTDTDGSWTITGLNPQSSGYLIVESGWFRSQCAVLTCTSGPGPDNDFPTANAFIRYPLSKLTVSTSNLDVGVLPDWPGASAAAHHPWPEQCRRTPSTSPPGCPGCPAPAPAASTSSVAPATPGR